MAPTLIAYTSGCQDKPATEVEFPQVELGAFGDGARALLEERLEVARSRPHDAQALGRSAMALHAYEVFEPALELYRRAAAQSGTDFRWHYLRGLVASEFGRQAEAEEAFRTAAQLEAGETFVTLRLAAAVIEAGRPREALDLYEELAATQDDSMALQFGRGSALAGLGRYEDAVTALQRAASLGADYRPLYYQLALALRSIGRKEEAARFLALYQRMEPDYRPPFPDPLLRQVEELREGSYLHHLNRGIGLEAAGRLEDALREYSRALKVEPAQVHARVNLISVYSEMGRPEDAAESYRETLEVNSEIEEAHYNYGVMLSRLGNQGEAETAYRQALAVNPYSAHARLNLGDTLEQQGRTAEAREEFRQVLQVNPGHRLAHFRLGMSLFQQGERSEALTHLRRTVDIKDEETPQFLVVLARAERALGNHTEAVRHVAEARRIARQHDLTGILAILDREFPATQ